MFHRQPAIRHASAIAPLFLTVWFALASPAQVPEQITYQGRLLSGTNLVNGPVNLKFNLYTNESALLFTFQSTSRVTAVDGLYAAAIGDQVTFGALTDALAYAEVWLEVVVNNVTLTPRERLRSAAYALAARERDPLWIAASNGIQAQLTGEAAARQAADAAFSAAITSFTGQAIADGSLSNVDLAPVLLSNTFWRLAGNAGTVTGAHFLGTTDATPLELRVNSQRVLRLSEAGGLPALAGGYAANVAVGGSVVAGGGGPGETQAVTAAHSAIGGGANNRVADRWSVIAGGRGNLIDTFDFPSDRDYGTIGGGLSNAIGQYALSGRYGTIGGGAYNLVLADSAFVGGGLSNQADGIAAAVVGGEMNSASAPYAVVGGGRKNAATGEGTAVGGGVLNAAVALHAVVAGGYSNRAADASAAVGGGQTNVAAAAYATVGGGRGNRATGVSSVIAGGEGNVVLSAQRSAIGGGLGNLVDNASYSVIAGGTDNRITGGAANGFIGGGTENVIDDGNQGAIAGGELNAVSATGGAIAGGRVNRVRTNALDGAVGGGEQNEVRAPYATVPGGWRNVAAGSNSLAAGAHATALHAGTFVWGDSRTNGAISITNDEFLVSASNGLRVADNLTTNRALDRFGRYYRDNAVQAWAVISGGGLLRDGFGIRSVTNVSQGVYNIVLEAAAQSGLTLCPVVTPELDSAPVGLAALRIAFVNQDPASNRFVQVFICNGSGVATNGDFNFILTGR